MPLSCQRDSRLLRHLAERGLVGMAVCAQRKSLMSAVEWLGSSSGAITAQAFSSSLLSSLQRVRTMGTVYPPGEHDPTRRLQVNQQPPRAAAKIVVFLLREQRLR